MSASVDVTCRSAPTLLRPREDAGVACLVVMSVRHGDHLIPLRGAPVTIGRSRDSGLRLTDPRLSGLHAEVFLREGAWHIRDAGSMNGTRVNGEPLGGERRLRPNDRVDLGGAATLHFFAAP